MALADSVGLEADFFNASSLQPSLVAARVCEGSAAERSSCGCFAGSSVLQMLRRRSEDERPTALKDVGATIPLVLLEAG